jgi:hypothetical protein
MSNEEEIAEPIELTREQAYKNVYEHLKGQDIKPMVEKKKVSNTFQPDFLSWTHVWEFLLQTYADFDLEYLEPIKHDDGTMTVQCRLFIPVNEHVLSRTERLYVMDNKMNAVKNPSAQAINKADKRCFVKCAALFGLGIQLYTGEDLPEVNTVTAEEKQQPEAAPVSETPPVESAEGTPWEGDPKVYTDTLIAWAEETAKVATHKNAFRNLYSENIAGITQLEEADKEQFRRLIIRFTELTKQIPQQVEEKSNAG